MNSIQNQPIVAGMSSGSSSLSDAQVASYMRKQSVSTYESMNAGLTIQTREGDVVTLSSNTYAQMDAYMYDSKGIVQTENGMAISSQSQRQISLSSGDSFTFSVKGDLSEAEFEDIEAIIKGIDGIIAEMAQGDMDEAVDKALAMGTYDSVSKYSADIKYERSYAAVTETRAQNAAIGTTPKTGMLSNDGSGSLFGTQPLPEINAPNTKGKNLISDIEKFFEKMTEQLEKHEDKQLARSKKGIDKLFNHHLKGEGIKGKGHEKETSVFNAIENAQKHIDSYIEKITSRLFDKTLSLF